VSAPRFTAGDWRVEPVIFPGPNNSPGDVAYVIVVDREGYSAPRELMSTTLQPADDDTGWLAEDKANADLAAAAPNLYAALSQLLRDIEPMEQAAGVRTASGDAARAALAMARGEGV